MSAIVKIKMLKAEVVHGGVYPKGAVVFTDADSAKALVEAGVAEYPSVPAAKPEPKKEAQK